VQMHHLRTIKDLKSKHKHLDWFTMQMAAINRKQVPLCRAHHKAVHNNTLTRVEKELFAQGCKNLAKIPKKVSLQYLCRKHLLESRMMGNYHVRFGGQFVGCKRPTF
jgi:hypothetical protein